jgi:hypothetical protein
LLAGAVIMGAERMRLGRKGSWSMSYKPESLLVQKRPDLTPIPLFAARCETIFETIFMRTGDGSYIPSLESRLHLCG